MQFLEESTSKSYQRVIDSFLTHQRKDIGAVSYGDVVNYLDKHTRRSSVDISAIKHYFDYLIETEVISSHPCKQLMLKSKKHYVQFQELFTREELETLLERPVRYEILRRRNKLIISLLIYQGLATANITNLKVQDIDLEKGTIYVGKTPLLTRRTLELKSSQVLLGYQYLNEDRKRLNPKDDNLFIGKLGNPFTKDSLNRMLLPLKSLFRGRNLNAKTIRQSVLVNWINEDKISIQDVQLLSGIKVLSTVEKYRKENQQEKVEMINRFFPL